MFKNIKACLFDMDGTLIDSMGIWRQIDCDYFGKFNKELPDDYQKRIEGLNMYETAVFTKEYYDFPDSVDKIMDDWNKMAREAYCNTIKFKPYVIEVLTLLRKKGIKLGVATSNSGYLFEGFAKSSNLYDYIEVAIVGEDVKYGKPKPDCYLEAAKRLGVTPDECLVFEDIIVGLTAGKNAGMKTCAVPDTYSLRSWDEKVAFADYSISGYDELIDIINNEI